MATRETILSTVTTNLKDDFPTDNVVNRFKTVDDLVSEPGDESKWPWLNVALSPHGGEFSLDGELESSVEIPINIVAYTISKAIPPVDLQIEVAKLIDEIVDSLSSAAHNATYCAARFGITRYDALPAEDEQHIEVGIAIVKVSFFTGD